MAKSVKILITLLALLGCIAVGIFSYNNYYIPYTLLSVLPEPDLSGVEKQVSDEVQTRLRAVHQNPKADTTWGKLAMILDVHGLKNESISCYKQANNLNQDDFRWPYFCAIVLNEMGSLEANHFFEKSIQLNQDYPPLQVRYGQALLNSNRAEEAEQFFHKAVILDSTSSHAYLGLAQIAISQDNLELSLTHLTKAIKLTPQFREAHGMLADVFRRLGKLDKAAQELQITQKLPLATTLSDPIYEELEAQGISAFWYKKRAFIFLNKNQPQEAVEEIRIALEFRPDPDGYNFLGNVLSQMGRHDEAANEFQKAITLAPNNVISYNNVGKALWRADKPQDASVWFERAIRLNPKVPELYLNLGGVYVQLTRPAEAVLTLQRGLRVIKDFVPIEIELAWLLATEPNNEVRDGAEALRLAKKTYEQTDHSDIGTLDVLAAAYAENREFTKAVQLARKAYQLALSNQQKAIANQIQIRLNLYLAGKPYYRREL